MPAQSPHQHSFTLEEVSSVIIAFGTEDMTRGTASAGGRSSDCGFITTGEDGNSPWHQWLIAPYEFLGLRLGDARGHKVQSMERSSKGEDGVLFPIEIALGAYRSCSLHGEDFIWKLLLVPRM